MATQVWSFSGSILVTAKSQFYSITTPFTLLYLFVGGESMLKIWDYKLKPAYLYTILFYVYLGKSFFNFGKSLSHDTKKKRHISKY